MKKVILTMTVLGLAVVGMQTANAGSFRISLNLGLPLFYPAPVICAPPPPTVVYSAPVYCPPPAPVVVYAPPVCYTPAPVVVYRSPVYYAPAPVYVRPAAVVSYRSGYGGEFHRSHHDRW